MEKIKEIFGCASIKSDERQGRHLVATRDIDSGTVILEEEVFFSSPSSYGGATGNFRRSCLGCYKEINNSHECSKCGWPICSKECEDSAQHKGNECPVFEANRVPPITKNYQYEFLKTIRSLLLRRNAPDKWDKILQLESHVAARRLRPDRIQLSYEAIEFIRSKCKMTEFEPATIDYILGVNAVNGFSIELPLGGKSSGGGGKATYFLFYLISLLSHDCEPNAAPKLNLSDPKNPNVSLISMRPIKAGEVITITYVDLRLGVRERQARLSQGYYFKCTCRRCESED